MGAGRGGLNFYARGILITPRLGSTEPLHEDRSLLLGDPDAKELLAIRPCGRSGADEVGEAVLIRGAREPELLKEKYFSLPSRRRQMEISTSLSTLGPLSLRSLMRASSSLSSFWASFWMKVDMLASIEAFTIRGSSQLFFSMVSQKVIRVSRNARRGTWAFILYT